MILLLLLAPVVFMFGAFGAAAYLDSERDVIGRAVSPDGRWTAQLERLIVGGAPNMVVTLRRSWHPDWYLTSCKTVSYYGESAAVFHWTSNTTLLVDAPPSQATGIRRSRSAGPGRGATRKDAALVSKFGDG